MQKTILQLAAFLKSMSPARIIPAGHREGVLPRYPPGFVGTPIPDANAGECGLKATYRGCMSTAFTELDDQLRTLAIDFTFIPSPTIKNRVSMVNDEFFKCVWIIAPHYDL
jgi:hypothetical protein